MITVRLAETDADLEAWRRIRIAVLPNERAASVEEMRRTVAPDRLLLLAELDGEVVGAGRRRQVGLRAGFVAPRVLEDGAPARRRHGAARALAEHVVARLHAGGANVDDPGSLAFAERFGFREVDRQVEQVRVVLDEEPAPAAGRRRDRPRGRSAGALGRLPTRPSARRRSRTWRSTGPSRRRRRSGSTSGSRIPRRRSWRSSGDEVIGCAGLQPDADFPERAENALTAVRRDWRGRGVATALKRMTLAWAAEHGIREVYTWTQRGNDDMRRSTSGSATSRAA